MQVDTDIPGGRAAFEGGYDVCVIGSGPAGISLARRLAGRGLAVALMEAGGLEWSEETQSFYAGDSVGLPTPPLEDVRLRYFGGTSGHWHGLCRALFAEDFRPRPENPEAGWPIAKADLDPYTDEVHEILELEAIDQGPDPTGAADAFRRVDFLRSPPVRFGEKYLDEITAAERITLGLNANLVDLRLNDTLDAVTGAVFKGYAAGDPGFTVTARAYALCCGGIENARLLLNFASQVPEGIGNGHGLVGRGFCDHPGTPTPSLGEVIFAAPGQAPSQFFSPTEAFYAEHAILPLYVRLDAVEHRKRSLLKEAARDLQCGLPFAEQLAAAVLGDSLRCGEGGGLTDWWQSRDPEAWPWGRVETNMQQKLNPDSRVTLGDARDPLGLRRAVLDWRLSPVDDRSLQAVALGFAAWYADRGLGRVRLYDWVLGDTPLETAAALGDTLTSWHHMCTTRMSDDPARGVVNPDCRVHGIGNLYVGGSSVFPSGGFVNPTYTVVQLALRLGDHLVDALAPQVAAPAPAPETLAGP